MTTTKVSEDQAKQAAARAEPEPVTMAFGFFRRYQKLIVYTAGIFTLLTFSITGAVMAVSERWSRDLVLPKIKVPGRPGEVSLTEEDTMFGSYLWKLKSLQDRGFNMLAVVPLISSDDDGDDPNRFAALRRLAIETGIEASADDAEQAIQAAIQQSGARSVADLASSHRIQDPSLFRDIVREALRISVFLRLGVLGTGVADEDAVRSILKDNDEIGFEVADLDLDAIKKRLEKVKVTDKQLDEFMKGLEEDEQLKYRHQTNRAAFEIAFVGVEAFDPKIHKGELEGYEPDEPEIRNFYDRYKDEYFKTEPPKKKAPPEDDEDQTKENSEKKNSEQTTVLGDGAASKPQENVDQDPGPATRPDDVQNPAPTHRPFDEVKAEILKKLQLKHVLRSWRKQLDAKVTEHMQPAFDGRYKVSEELTKAEADEKEAQDKLDENPDDKQLEKALEAAKKDVEAKEKAYEAANKAVEQRLGSFDFKKAVKELAKGSAVQFASVEEPKFAEDLKELPAGLGTWNGSFAATSVASSGEIHSTVQDIQNGAFLLRVTQLNERPYKEFAEVKDDLTVHYYTHKADKEGEEKKEKFEKALERLSREKAKDEIAKIEKKQADELNKRVENWRDKLQKEIEECEAKMAQLEAGDWVYNRLKTRRDAAKKKLEGENKFRKETKKELDDGTKDEIKELEKKHYKEVLAAAAKDLFELVKVGPYTKRLQEMPRFTESHSKLVRFLFKKSELMEMKEGEATDLLEDTTERRICLAVCTKVRKAESSSISRRQWKAKQDGMTMFALRQRFIANPQELLVSLFRAFQQDPSLRPLQPLFYQAMGGNKEKARELVNHPTFLPLLQRMVSGSIPFASAQKQLAANQSFTLDALKRGYGWRDPSASKRGPGADANNPDADKDKSDSKPTSEKTAPGK